jgi:hypothetical protein
LRGYAKKMITAANLLEIPVTYDIVVGDFGRDATIEYQRLVAEQEKQLINKILANENLDFFDEYRRIMYSVVADIAFLKKDEIRYSTRKHGHLTDEILIGVGTNSGMSQDFVDRVLLTVIQSVFTAVSRGYKRIRIMIPCNTLSGLTKQIGEMIHSNNIISNYANKFSYLVQKKDLLDKVNISIHTVIDSVIRHSMRTKDISEKINFLVLGTRGTNELYTSYGQNYPISVLPLENWEYKLIDKTVVASIGGDREKIFACSNQLQTDLIAPRRKIYNNLFVLEACTDFHLGLGTSSLEAFASEMVLDCYQPLESSN